MYHVNTQVIDEHLVNVRYYYYYYYFIISSFPSLLKHWSVWRITCDFDIAESDRLKGLGTAGSESSTISCMKNVLAEGNCSVYRMFCNPVTSWCTFFSAFLLRPVMMAEVAWPCAVWHWRMLGTTFAVWWTCPAPSRPQHVLRLTTVSCPLVMLMIDSVSELRTVKHKLHLSVKAGPWINWSVKANT